MKKIDYTVELRDFCEKKVTDYILKNDGVVVGPGRGKTVGKLGAVIISMPMNIPNIATVSWQEENGSKHEYDIPLRSLIKTKDIMGSKFKIIYGVCDSDLTVVFAKKTGKFEYSKKEIWSSKKES